VGVAFSVGHKQALLAMACSSVISFYSIAKMFAGNEKMIERGENALKSGHITAFGYDADIGRIYGEVQASMKKVNYHVEVSNGTS